MSAYYLVRAMDQTERQYALFFERERVAVGWSAVDFTEGDPESVVARVVERYYAGTGTDPRYVGIKKNEVRRFLRIAEHDRVVVPVPGGVRLAEVTGGVVHEAEAGTRDLDLANQRPVQYRRGAAGDPVTIPSSDLSEGLRRRLRVRGAAVRDLSEFAGELDRLFAGQRPAAHTEAEEGRIETAFHRDLLNAIQYGRTRLDAGGQGLEHLVAELIQADGYTTHVLSKRAFPGLADADVQATRRELGQERRLLVQVKHHSGTSGTWGAEQLGRIGREIGDEWAGYDLVLVTAARASDALADLARLHQITLLDGEALVAWIAERHASLSQKSKHALGLSKFPARYDPIPG